MCMESFGRGGGRVYLVHSGVFSTFGDIMEYIRECSVNWVAIQSELGGGGTQYIGGLS